MKALRGFGSVSGRLNRRPRSKRIVRKGFYAKDPWFKRSIAYRFKDKRSLVFGLNPKAKI